jgi:ribonuclease-3
LIGAIYLDQGYRKCLIFVKTQIIDKYIPLNKIVRKEVNFKSNLIEWSQKHKLDILFELIETFTDQDGNPVFQTSVSLMGTPLGIGIGYTKKESQQAAARMAIRKIRKDKDVQQLIVSLKKKLHGEKVANILPEYPEEGDDEESISDD